MAIEYRKDRKRWGYRVCLHGKRYKKFAWLTKSEAKDAERSFLVEQKTKPQVPKNALVSVVSMYLVDSAEFGRSKWRLDGLRWNFQKFILPYFGPQTLISRITEKEIEAFIVAQKRRGVGNNTIHHYITDLNSCLNWAVRKRLLVSNPVKFSDLSAIKNRKPKKAPLNFADIDRAANVLDGYDRLYFNFLRFTGLRKDESNRVEWTDINLTDSWLTVRGTKTEESEAEIPLPLWFRDELAKAYQQRGESPYVFPGRSHQTKGKKIYSRRRLFERIKKRTGIHLRPKDLRDYFASVVATKVNDPNVVMRLLRHTNLTTTSKYLRFVKDRMSEAVKDLGATLGGHSGGQIGGKSPDFSNRGIFEKSELSTRGHEKNFGGGGGSRTHDAADMSRVL
jgi:integrase